MENIEKMTKDQLVSLIEKCNSRYWKDGWNPDATDAEYDALTRKLRELDPEHPLLHKVGEPEVAGSGKVVHVKQMLSLDKAYDLAAVMTWAEKYRRSPEERFLVQPKYDGISALWDGKILSTRGDGLVGEDISGKLPLIELETIGKTEKLSSASPAPVLGEIVIREDDFQTIYSKILNKNGSPYKNTRNAAAGIMGLKDISDMLRQGAKLTLVDYNLHSVPLLFSELETRWEETVRSLRALPYPMDGIVVKLADFSYSESLGNTAHHPRGQIAYKFSGEPAHRTKLRNVTWSFGKNCLTPLAEFEPVEIGGTTIRKATLHNLQNILDKDIHIGDYVTVERAGDVIPYIKTVEPGPERRSCVITHCPCCGSELVKDLPELRCVNPECEATLVQLLLSAIAVLGIDCLGEAKVESLVREMKIHHISALFRMGELDLQQIAGVKGKTARNLYRQIQAARDIPDWKLLTALNIKGVGANMAKLLLDGRSLAELRGMDEEALSSIRGMGPERAATVRSELIRQSSYLDELLAVRTAAEPEPGLF